METKVCAENYDIFFLEKLQYAPEYIISKICLFCTLLKIQARTTIFLENIFKNLHTIF